MARCLKIANIFDQFNKELGLENFESVSGSDEMVKVLPNTPELVILLKYFDEEIGRTILRFIESPLFYDLAGEETVQFPKTITDLLQDRQLSEHFEKVLSEPAYFSVIVKEKQDSKAALQKFIDQKKEEIKEIAREDFYNFVIYRWDLPEGEEFQTFLASLYFRQLGFVVGQKPFFWPNVKLTDLYGWCPSRSDLVMELINRNVLPYGFNVVEVPLIRFFKKREVKKKNPDFDTFFLEAEHSLTTVLGDHGEGQKRDNLRTGAFDRAYFQVPNIERCTTEYYEPRLEKLKKEVGLTTFDDAGYRMYCESPKLWVDEVNKVELVRNFERDIRNLLFANLNFRDILDLIGEANIDTSFSIPRVLEELLKVNDDLLLNKLEHIIC